MNPERPSVPITDIRLRIVENGHDGLVAWASCIVANTIKLDNVSIRRGHDGSLFLTYPAKRTAGGDRFYYFHPISTDAANAVKNAVLARLATLAKAAVEGGAEIQ